MYCGQYMTTPPTFVFGDTPLQAALTLMLKKHMQHLAVVERDMT